ncbi:hypothetical protein J6590_025955 [Homalodisca vitripennis]|nr:hypothetical protein J6590_025955 [Homalodisca vitripennis]
MHGRPSRISPSCQLQVLHEISGADINYGYTVRNHSCEHVPLWLTSMVAGGWPSPWPPLHTKAARLPGTAQEERTVAYTGV